MEKKKITTKGLKILKIENNSKKIGLVHGAFDFFHYGHLLHLEKAKSLCDILIVSLTSGEFIKKGPGRPLYDNKQREKIISSLAIVDYVYISENDSSVELINLLKPDIYFKGSDYIDLKKDYTKKIFKEIKAVKKNKGKIIFTNEKTFSSTKIINNHSGNFSKELKKYLIKISRTINVTKIQELFYKIKKLKVLIIGEVILDRYTFTEPLGKSPKEQLIPVKINFSELYGGGVIATANSVINFTNDCTLLTVLGNNKKENKIIKKLINKKVKGKFFLGSNEDNIEKNRFIDNNTNHKLFQTTNIEKLNLTNSLQKKILNYLKNNMKNFDLIMIHDFGHGLLKEKIIKILQTQSKKLSVNVQTNSTNAGYNYLTKYSKMNYFSIDEPEARLALRDLEGNSLNLFNKLKKKIKYKLGTITFGGRGTNIFNGKTLHFAPALSKEPVDTLGAGDAYFALSSLFTKVTSNIKIIALIGNIAGALKIKFVGHRKTVEKDEFISFLKSILNI